MCEFCSRHGDGKIWFKNAANYASDLTADMQRRRYIESFFESAIGRGAESIGRLESLYRKRSGLPGKLVQQMVEKAKLEHFGQVVTIEDIRDIVGKAATVVRLPCACRWASLKKENRCCYSVSYSPEAWYEELDMSYFGKADSCGLESLTPAEAIAQMETLDRDGVVHTIWTMMTPFIGAICNCTPQECLGLRTLAVEVETMFRGEQAAQVDHEKCTGCGACDAVCYFDAIKDRQDSEGFKAEVNVVKCFGCGLCRHSCPEGALSMVDREVLPSPGI